VSTEREELESICADIGAVIRSALPSGTGFALVLFDFGEKGNMAYVSTGQRADTIRVLRELAGNLERSLIPGSKS
jgi:GTPase